MRVLATAFFLVFLLVSGGCAPQERAVAASLLALVAWTGNESTGAGPPAHDPPDVGGSKPASLTPLAADELDLPAAWVDGTSLGSPDAPVVVQVWHDYFCPSCAQFAAKVEPDIVNTYVRNGQVRLEFHHFPLGQHEPGGSRTALAALCAADQGLFYRFQHRLFELSAQLGQAGLTTAALVGAAGELGMDTVAFTNCLDDATHWAALQDSITQAYELELYYVPSVLVNDTLLDNAMDLAAAIDAALGE